MSRCHIITVTERGAATPNSLRQFDCFTATDIDTIFSCMHGGARDKQLRSEQCVRMVDIILQEAGTRRPFHVKFSGGSKRDVSLAMSKSKFGKQDSFQTGRVFRYEQGEVW